MQCTTVRVVAEVSDDNQSGFVVINLADFDPAKHQPFDQESDDALRAAGPEALPAVVSGVRAELQQRHEDLQAEAERQRVEAEALAAERERLQALAKSLEKPAAAPDVAAKPTEAAAGETTGRKHKAHKAE